MGATADEPARLRVNPEVVRAAREQANLGLEEAAVYLSKLLKREHGEPVQVDHLLSWETGTQLPTELQAEALARVYLVPFVSLFRETPPHPAIRDFRLGARGKIRPLSYETVEELSRFSQLYALAKKVSSALGTLEDVSIPERALSSIERPEDVEGIARDVRGWLGITYEEQTAWPNEAEALARWTEKLEAVGIFVLQLPMPVEECRGASKWERGGPPAILLSTADTSAGRLFTLVHEFAHLVFKTGDKTIVCEPIGLPGPREDKFANRFAGAALVPRDLLTPLLPPRIPSQTYRLWPESDRQRLRRVLKVSHAVIGIRLVELGIVADAGYEWRPSRRPMGGPSRPVWERFRRYLGARSVALARQAVSTERITAAEVSRILDIKVTDAEAIVGGLAI